MRDSKHGGAGSPYTLTVLSGARLYNINIRYSTVQYMLVQCITVQYNIRQVRGGGVALGKQKQDEKVSRSSLSEF